MMATGCWAAFTGSSNLAVMHIMLLAWTPAQASIPCIADVQQEVAPVASPAPFIGDLGHECVQKLSVSGSSSHQLQSALQQACWPRRILVHTMKDPRKAEQYCDRQYDLAAQDGTSTSSIKRSGSIALRPSEKLPRSLSVGQGDPVLVHVWSMV